ncbi:TPA: trypsin-like serine protease [Candidatus Woesearchaeota archaeon]|nr:trypsin-like serine protease [Candidatus Woesearchaeota archaeon]
MMVEEKELEDYVKVQQSLGVSEAEIRKSLLSAGYTEEDFKHLMTKQSKKAHPRKEITVTAKHVLYLNAVIVIVFGMFLGYLTYDYNAKINQLSIEQEQGISQVSEVVAAQETQFSEQLDSVSSDMSSEIEMTKQSIENVEKGLRSSIQEYNYQSINRDTALSDSIQKMSNRSLTELSLFGQQLATVQESSVDFGPVIPKSINAVVTIGQKGAGYFTTAGSGVIINEKGYVVTNYHVVDDLKTVTVRVDGDEYTATMIGKNEAWDIAVIKLITEKEDFEYLDWADSSKVAVGQHVIAIGNPVGFESTVTEGIISNTNRLISGEEDIYYLQTDVAINAGNSGGPLIDKNGNIVGIATLKYAKMGVEGLSFALRSNDIKGVVLNILQEE